MNLPNYLIQLNNNENIDIDCFIDESMFLDLISHPKVLNINNLISLIQLFWTASNNSKIAINEFIINHPHFEEIFVEKFNIPNKISGNLNLSSQSFETYCYINYKISNENIELLKQFNFSENISIDLYREPGTLLNYNDVKPISNNPLNLIKSFKMNSMAFSVVLLAANLLNNSTNASLLSSFNLLHQNRIGTHSIESNDSFFDHIELVSKDLQNSTNPKSKLALKKLKELSHKDLSHYLNFNNENKINENHENESEKISKIIASFYHNSKNPHIHTIANAIVHESKSRAIDYKIMIAIMKVESDFDQSSVSSTGDLSVAQINYNVWNEELSRVKKIKLNKNRLKTDIGYSVFIMGEILEILESRHKQDPNWYARYHSSTPSLKMEYANKVHKQMNHISSQELEILKINVLDSIFYLRTVLNDTDSISDSINQDNIKILISSLNKVHNKITIAQKNDQESKKYQIAAK